MTPAHPVAAGRTGTHWPGLRVVPVVLALVAGASACSSVPHRQGAPHAGSYPVATPGENVRATPLADDANYRLVSAGDTVAADVGPARLVALAAGPELTVPPGPPRSHVDGVLTVTLRSERGTATLPTGSFLLLDEGREPIAYVADVASVTVTPGAPAVVHLTADLPAGHATLTWQPTGHPMVTWDFVVEVD